MDNPVGKRVVSVKGRDKGSEYIVIKVLDQYFVLCADGRKKTMKSPKRKNIKHISFIEGFTEGFRFNDSDTDTDDRIRKFLSCHNKEE